MKRVEKTWGYELWIANSPLYCGKLLHFRAGTKCSLHYHKLKDETFYVSAGVAIISLNGAMYRLARGGSLHVPPGIRHQIYALEELDLFEFSTQHFDEDSYRILEERLKEPGINIG